MVPTEEIAVAQADMGGPERICGRKLGQISRYCTKYSRVKSW